MQLFNKLSLLFRKAQIWIKVSRLPVKGMSNHMDAKTPIKLSKVLLCECKICVDMGLWVQVGVVYAALNQVTSTLQHFLICVKDTLL